LPRYTQDAEQTGEHRLDLVQTATTMAIIFLRTAANGVQNSIYVVYLKGIGLTGTSIGILFAAIEITSGLGLLLAGRRCGSATRNERC
jgi:hypothetical protein